MIKDIFSFVLARLISSRTENWYISCVGIRAIVANSRLKLQGMEHVVHTPLARHLKAKAHNTNSSNVKSVGIQTVQMAIVAEQYDNTHYRTPQQQSPNRQHLLGYIHALFQ